jgi:putative MFS transporter
MTSKLTGAASERTSAPASASASASASGPAALIVARLDRLPATGRSHRTWIVLLALVFGFELADLTTFALTAPTLREQWGISVGEIGWITSSAFIGMFVGALVGGPLADRFGRKPTLIGGALFYSASSLLSACASDFGLMTVSRVLTGFGMEAMTVAGLAFVSEMFPAALRGRYQALILGLGVIGIPTMSWFARLVVPLGDDGWRLIFVFGALGVVVAVAMVKKLPESARWSATHGRYDDAERTLGLLEAEVIARTGEALPEPRPALLATDRPRMRALFAAGLRGRTLVMCIGWVCSILGFYGFTSWTATLLNARGFDAGVSLTYTSVVAVGAVPGALTAWFVSDRFERKHALLVVNLLIAALVLVYGFVDNLAVVLIAGFLVNYVLQCQTAILYAYTPEVFPLNLRGAGTGLTNGVGRLSGVAGGAIVAAIFSGLGMGMVFVYVAAVMALGGIVLAVFGARSRVRLDAAVSADGALISAPAPETAAATTAAGESGEKL